MQLDFHYYATYCAAILAGYTHEQSQQIAYSAQLVDECTVTFLKGLKAPRSAATTQLQLELADAGTDPVSLQDITRIWASFHFLPYDLKADPGFHCSRRYRNKYRLICRPNSDLMVDTVRLAQHRGLQAAGLAMHVLADTWAHANFAGTPSAVINNTNHYFYEVLASEDGSLTERKVEFRHSPGAPDDLEQGIYTNTLPQGGENSVMNLGHGRAGHLPDYSWARYRYLPAWGQYEELVKDNPSDYLHAFCQMISALKFLNGVTEDFGKEQYDTEAIRYIRYAVRDILIKRQPDASEDWKELGQRLSGQPIEDFDLEKYRREYLSAPESVRDDTFLGRFFLAAMAQKSMVTNRIFRSGSLLAGFSVDYNGKKAAGIRDYMRLVNDQRGKLK